MMTESLLLGIIGDVAGCGVGWMLLRITPGYFETMGIPIVAGAPSPKPSG